jgi:hypothetical protein
LVLNKVSSQLPTSLKPYLAHAFSLSQLAMLLPAGRAIADLAMLGGTFYIVEHLQGPFRRAKLLVKDFVLARRRNVVVLAGQKHRSHTTS